jgi:phosphate acyltransferase
VKIALDAMGGDLAPKAAIEGAVLAARDFGVAIVAVGNRDVIARELEEHDTNGLAIEIEHAAEVVGMDDSPLESVFGKPESSIHVGLELVKRGNADGFVSAGNSGAIMAAAMAILGNLAGVDRPAIASLVPSTAGFALLIDAGANTDVKPLNLMQFGVMGAAYWKHVYKVERPRVGILSNGEEASKGTDLTRAAAAALTQLAPQVNYIGYVEGRDINRNKADVVVTDGFTGNVALKTMEGFAGFMMGNLREVFGGGMLRRLAFLLVRKKLRAIRERLDPAEYGGAPLLGVNGVTIIAHGSSNGRAIRNAIRAAADEALVRHVNAEIVEILGNSPTTLPARPAGRGIRGLFTRMRDRLHLHREAADHKAERGDKAERNEKGDRIEASRRAFGVSEPTYPPGAAANHDAEGAGNNRKAPPDSSRSADALAGNGTAPAPDGLDDEVVGETMRGKDAPAKTHP